MVGTKSLNYFKGICAPLRIRRVCQQQQQKQADYKVPSDNVKHFENAKFVEFSAALSWPWQAQRESKRAACSMQHAASSKCSYQTIARMAGAALKLYVHKLIYRISYFLFGVALGPGEWRGSAAACILSSCRLSAQPDYAAYKVNSDHSRRGKGGKKSNNFGLLCCSLLIATERAALRQIQIKNHAKWTSSWQLSFKCTLLIRRVVPRPTQLDTHAANFRVSLSPSISLDSRFYSTRAATCRKKKKKQKKTPTWSLAGNFC